MFNNSNNNNNNNNNTECVCFYFSDVASFGNEVA